MLSGSNMKRSEMVRKIAKYLVGKEPYQMFPHEILDLIEKAGMLPPFSGKTKQMNVEDRWGRDTGQMAWTRVMANEWEAEDEETSNT